MTTFRLLISTLLLALCAVGVLAQEAKFVRPSVASSISSQMRYEIVQTNLYPAGHFTFRLDKFTGRIFQLGSCPQRSYIGSGLCWKEMTVLELPKPVADNTAKYQIFIQGEGGRSVMLINTLTGQTWQHGKDGAEMWTPFLDQITLPQSYEVIK